MVPGHRIMQGIDHLGQDFAFADERTDQKVCTVW
jgi:hypothetical protein